MSALIGDDVTVADFGPLSQIDDRASALRPSGRHLLVEFAWQSEDDLRV